MFIRNARLRSLALFLSLGMIFTISGCKPSAVPVSSEKAPTSGVFSQAGTYTDSVEGDAIVEVDGVVLSGISISGNLVISDSVGEGDVTLDNVTVRGDTVIRGGGVHSIKASNSSFANVRIEKDGSAVRFLTQNTKMQSLTVASAAILEGVFNQVECQGNAVVTVRADIQELSLLGKAQVTLESGLIDSARIEKGAEQSMLTVGTQAKVEALSVLSSAKVAVEGVVTHASVGEAAAGASFTGAGTLSTVSVAAKDVTIQVPGAKVTTTLTPEQPASSSSTPAKKPGGTRTPSVRPPAQSSTPTTDTSTGSSSGNNTGGGGGSTPAPAPAPTIVAVESVQNGLVRVTLSAPTASPLTADRFSILCTGGGKDMTIQQVKTTDNRVYDLVTAYYNDNTYNLEITLPNGVRLSQDFISKYDCPEIRSTLLRRTSATQAQFLFYSDSDGTFYYLMQEIPSARAATATEPTAEQIMQSGHSAAMKRQGNTIAITGLTEDVSYSIYYVAKGVDGTVTPTKAVKLPAAVEENQKGTITVESASGFAIPGAGFTDELCGFTLTLSEPTSIPLTLDAFRVSCPASGMMSIGRVATTDNRVYKLYMQPGYMFISNNTMTARITFPNGDFTTHDFYADIEAPTTGLVTMEWLDKDNAQASFSASEAGWIYYAILDTVESTTGTKDPSFLFAQGPGVTKTALATDNRITLPGATAGKFFCYATEDNLGNKIEYMGYEEIPPYIPPVTPPDEDALAITSIAYSFENGKPTFRITFNKKFNVSTLDSSATSVTGVAGTPMFQRDSIEGTDSDVIVLRIGNGVTVAPGEQTFTLKTWDGVTLTAKVLVS